MIVKKINIRKRIMCFVLAFGLLVCSVFNNYCVVYAVSEEILITVMGWVADAIKDFCVDEVKKSIDEVDVVTSDSSFPDFSNKERLLNYIETHGDYELAKRWVDLKQQYLACGGRIDREYYIAFYQALANNIVYDINNILVDKYKEVAENPFAYADICKSDKALSWFSDYNFYVITDYGNYNNSNLHSSYRCYFFTDLYYGVSRYEWNGDKTYYGNLCLGDFSAYLYYSGGNLCGTHRSSLSASTWYNSIVYDTDKTVLVSPENPMNTKYVDYYKDDDGRNKYMYFIDLYTASIVDFAQNKIVTQNNNYQRIRYIGLTPKGKVTLKNDAGDIDAHLKKNLQTYQNSDKAFPIFVQKPDTDGTNINDYVGVGSPVKIDDFSDDYIPKFLDEHYEGDIIELDDDIDCTIVPTGSTALNTASPDSTASPDFPDVPDDENGIKLKFPWLNLIMPKFDLLINTLLDLPKILIDGMNVSLKLPNLELPDITVNSPDINLPVLPDFNTVVTVPLDTTLKNILNTVVEMPVSIWDSAGGSFQELFVPYDNYFIDKFKLVREKFEKKFDIAKYQEIVGKFKEIEPTAPVLGTEQYPIDLAIWDKHLPKVKNVLRGVMYPLILFAHYKFIIWLIRGSNFKGGSNNDN